MPIRTTPVEARQVQRLLPGVPVEALPEVAGSARAVTYRAGEMIMGNSHGWSPAVINDGTVRLTIRAQDGREATLRTIGRGALVGLVSLFDPGYASPYSDQMMVAVERSTIVFFEPEVILGLVQRYPDFAMHVMKGLVAWGSALSDAAGRFAFMSVRRRVVSHLLGAAEFELESPETPVVTITQQELADAVGSVREVVARTLRELRVANLISVGRARITLLDRERLAREAAGLG